MRAVRRSILSLAALGLLACTPGAATGQASFKTEKDETGVTRWNSGCPAGKATYKLRHEDDWAAGFRKVQRPSVFDHLFWLRSGKSGKTYWFEMNSGNGYSSITIIPIEDPDHPSDPEAGPRQLTEVAPEPPAGDETARELAESLAEVAGSIHFYPFGRDMVFGYEPPYGDADAPPRFFIPELGPVFWYFGEVVGASDVERESFPRAVFELATCDGRPVTPAV